MQATVKVHALNPLAVRQRKSLGDTTGLTALGFHRIELAPGHDSSEYHRHLYEEECVYVLSGHGTALIDERAHAVGPGDFLGFARGGPAHVLSNSSDEPLVLLVVGQRLEQDVCDYPHRGLRLYINGKQEDLVEFGAIQPG
nr:cupin domain-containing protein [Dyella sedimenti]